ncbi:MalY/PatB family protein [Lachnospira multipara]|uniref:cysteine-S-conjugate beta-lyase n=1 Tax=Lachnospira multipara TaxID=28051 RepID=A0A1H5WJJ8_9FIRM|nr:MalY/PatB family protein [Lachnospira multipara]MCR5516222.1 pyridoxal phosphate-dependent aminotransferase [Lachnospira sp.]SEF99672.1 cystathione beta-lyase [Lachnospira multipara]
MGKYNFDEEVNRRSSDSLKWDVDNNELPMWVADMDFKTAPQIRQAIADRLEHGVFGYADIMQDWYDAYINWWKNRHGFEIQKEWLIFSTGVVPSISSIVRKLTTPNEKVIIQTPVYNIFFNSIVNNGCRPLESPLKYEDGKYTMDFKDLEEKMADPQASLMILCNPHNPVGKIWDKESLEKVGELAAKYGVTVISDEIHCDITKPNKSYIPFASVSETCRDISITCIAPTKCFNIAGMQTSAVVVSNPFLRHKVWRGLNTDEVAEPNSFAQVVTKAAFNESADWLDEMREYVFDNREYAKEFIERECEGIHVVDGDATYLLWIDISKCNKQSDEVARIIREKTGLYITEGLEYGQAGANFIRMNVACTKKTLQDGLNRFKEGINSLL